MSASTPDAIGCHLPGGEVFGRLLRAMAFQKRLPEGRGVFVTRAVYSEDDEENLDCGVLASLDSFENRGVNRFSIIETGRKTSAYTFTIGYGT